MKISKIIKKQGGLELFRKYMQAGAFFPAVVIFLLLGKSRTALEILRLSAQFKTKKKLHKQYCKDLVQFEELREDNLEHKNSDNVWFCWLQGIENAPKLVKKCYANLIEMLPGKKIILITSENMFDYVGFPDYITRKWEKGIITNTHMTDLLRLELLIGHGGMWVDSTVLCMWDERKIPDYFFDSDLFLYQCLKPGRDGHSTYISSWLISACTNNKILMATRYLCYEYWKHNDKMIDYFLFHNFISIVLEYYPEEWNRIVPCDNAVPHILLLRLFERYDEKMWNAIKGQTPFHKLSYKFEKEEMELNGTYYDILINGKDSEHD